MSTRPSIVLLYFFWARAGLRFVSETRVVRPDEERCDAHVPENDCSGG